MQEFDLSKERMDLWKRIYLKGCSEDEFSLFKSICARTGLSPEARQIYAVKRWDKREGRDIFQFQTSIDGFRLIADRSSQYAGQLGPFFSDGTRVVNSVTGASELLWLDGWADSVPPVLAKVGVLRHDFKEPCWGVAKWSSYVQTDRNGSPTHMWAKMPEVLLSKCSEALALRKGFPAELSGLYTSDEMAQAMPIESKVTTLVANEIPLTPKASAGFDKNNVSHVETVKKVLLEKNVDGRLIQRIIDKMEGKRSSDIPLVIQDVVLDSHRNQEFVEDIPFG
jgi:phage recombination protein Bet